MEGLFNYDIVENNTSCSTSFPTSIAKHKQTSKLFQLQAISCVDLSESEQKSLINKVKIRINLSHPNILDFYGYFQQNDSIYLKQEYCELGSLTTFIQKECIEKDRRLHESLIYRILYQTVFALKTIDCFMGQLNLDTISLNEDYNIKLYNFIGATKNQKQKEVKMSQLGTIIFQLCTLKSCEKSAFESSCYTSTFKELVISMMKDHNEIKKHINKILCNPTILLQSSQWNKESCFIDKLQQPLKKADSTELSDTDYSQKLDKLRRKEAALQIKEQLLKEQERKLTNKEKKLQIMERTVKEKLQQAELYLKRCREGGKSISSASSKSSSHSQSSSQSKKMSYDDSDPNYVSCGDTDIFPTSSKLQVDKIIKPHNFSRTLSERKIRFKTSPLKDHNAARKRDVRKSFRHSQILEENDLQTNKTLFMGSKYENNYIMTVNSEYEKTPCEMNTVGWTQETKKYAFEMLRFMNSEEKENVDIKHTYL